MAGYYIDIDGDQWGITEALYQRLHEEALIEDCDECSSEFGGHLVAHPTDDNAEGAVLDILKAEERKD